MNATAFPLYTNEVSPEYLRTHDKSPFTEQQLSTFSEQALAAVKQQQDYIDAHPSVAIYRLATQGSQTRNGGVIEQTTSAMVITLPNGLEVRAAQKGDHAVYPDGTKAQIVTASGHDFDHIALVGSCLSNGDQIINTPQDAAVLVERKGVPMAEDFLPTIRP